MDGLGEGFVSGNANATRNAFLGGPVGSSDTVLVSVERLSIVRQPQGFLRRGDKLFANLDRVKSLLNPGPGLFRRVPLPNRVTELGSDGVKAGTVPLYKGTRVDGMRSTEAFICPRADQFREVLPPCRPPPSSWGVVCKPHCKNPELRVLKATSKYPERFVMLGSKLSAPASMRSIL